MNDTPNEYTAVFTLNPKAKPLHELVTELKENFFENSEIPDLLLKYNNSMPNSFFDIVDSIFLRTQVLVELEYANYALDMVTKPHMAVVQSNIGKIVAPDEDDKTTVKTPEGHDFQALEQLQDEYLKNGEVIGAARDFQSSLNSSFDVFNLKMILNMVNGAKNTFIPPFGKEPEVYKKIQVAFNIDSYSALDSAYYNHARRFMNQAYSSKNKLNESEIGKFFITGQDVIKEVIRQKMFDIFNYED